MVMYPTGSGCESESDMAAIYLQQILLRKKRQKTKIQKDQKTRRQKDKKTSENCWLVWRPSVCHQCATVPPLPPSNRPPNPFHPNNQPPPFQPLQKTPCSTKLSILFGTIPLSYSMVLCHTRGVDIDILVAVPPVSEFFWHYLSANAVTPISLASIMMPKLVATLIAPIQLMLRMRMLEIMEILCRPMMIMRILTMKKFLVIVCNDDDEEVDEGNYVNPVHCAGQSEQGAAEAADSADAD